MTYKIDIRPRRQVTLPSDLLKELGVSVGDAVEICVEGQKAILKPKKIAALDALAEIKDAFKKADVSKEDLLNELDQQRQNNSQNE